MEYVTNRLAFPQQGHPLVPNVLPAGIVHHGEHQANNVCMAYLFAQLLAVLFVFYSDPRKTRYRQLPWNRMATLTVVVDDVGRHQFGRDLSGYCYRFSSAGHLVQKLLVDEGQYNGRFTNISVANQQDTYRPSRLSGSHFRSRHFLKINLWYIMAYWTSTRCKRWRKS